MSVVRNMHSQRVDHNKYTNNAVLEGIRFYTEMTLVYEICNAYVYIYSPALVKMKHKGNTILI